MFNLLCDLLSTDVMRVDERRMGLTGEGKVVEENWNQSVGMS